MEALVDLGDGLAHQVHGLRLLEVASRRPRLASCRSSTLPCRGRVERRVLAVLAREMVLGGRLGHAMDPTRRPCFEEAHKEVG